MKQQVKKFNEFINEEHGFVLDEEVEQLRNEHHILDEGVADGIKNSFKPTEPAKFMKDAKVSAIFDFWSGTIELNWYYEGKSYQDKVPIDQHMIKEINKSKDLFGYILECVQYKIMNG